MGVSPRSIHLLTSIKRGFSEGGEKNMVEKLIRCTRCNKVIPQIGSFGDFAEISLLPGVEWSSEDLDEQKEFLRQHEGHLLEELFIDRGSFFSDKPYFELMKVAYVEASNGQQKFLIRRTRASFDRPAFYELIPGKIQVSDVSFRNTGGSNPVGISPG